MENKIEIRQNSTYIGFNFNSPSTAVPLKANTLLCEKNLLNFEWKMHKVRQSPTNWMELRQVENVVYAGESRINWSYDLVEKLFYDINNIWTTLCEKKKIYWLFVRSVCTGYSRRSSSQYRIPIEWEFTQREIALTNIVRVWDWCECKCE